MNIPQPILFLKIPTAFIRQILPFTIIIGVGYLIIYLQNLADII